MTAREARKFIGKMVQWEVTIDRNRGAYRLRSGILNEVSGKNVRVDDDWHWLPDMTGLKEVTNGTPT